MSNATPEQMNNAVSLLRSLRSKSAPVKPKVEEPAPVKVEVPKPPRPAWLDNPAPVPVVESTTKPKEEAPEPEVNRSLDRPDAMDEGDVCEIRERQLAADNLNQFPLETMLESGFYYGVVDGIIINRMVYNLTNRNIKAIVEEIGGDTFADLHKWCELRQNKLTDIPTIGKKTAELLVMHRDAHPDHPRTELHPDHPWHVAPAAIAKVKEEPIAKVKEEPIVKPNSTRLTTTQDAPPTKKESGYSYGTVDGIIVKRTKVKVKKPTPTQEQDVVDTILNLRTKVMALGLDKVAEEKVMNALHEAAVWTKFRW